MKKILLLNFVIIQTCWLNLFAQEFTCKIKGTVIGRNNTEILLTPITEDFNSVMFLSKGILIPVKDNRFEYDLKVPVVQSYLLIFRDEIERQGYLTREFFPDSSSIEIKIYPDDQYKKNTFKGGKLNSSKSKIDNLLYSKLGDLETSIDSLRKSKKFFTEKYQNITDQILKEKDIKVKEKLGRERRLLNDTKEVYTPEASVIVDKQDSIYQDYRNSYRNYIQTNQNIYSYSLLYKIAHAQPKIDDINLIKSIYPLYARKYPSHPYTKKVEELMNAINMVRVGGHFIDFSAPTIDNKLVRISDSIKGKVALIDLWASWCGPCRAKSKSMIPIYEKYKSKGFVIIGVAGEFKNTDAFKLALEKDKYPWLNLIELNTQNGIWSKYGIAGAGGSTYLVDATGKILAINANDEEVEIILNNLLK